MHLTNKRQTSSAVHLTKTEKLVPQCTSQITDKLLQQCTSQITNFFLNQYYQKYKKPDLLGIMMSTYLVVVVHMVGSPDLLGMVFSLVMLLCLFWRVKRHPTNFTVNFRFDFRRRGGTVCRTGVLERENHEL